MMQTTTYELKPIGDGRFYLEAYGFKSIPFELKHLNQNKEWFSQALHGEAQGTVQ